jgi:ribosomal protein S18 acetylase RimI-like enzyme
VTRPLADPSREAVVRALEAHTREQAVAWSGSRANRVEDRPDMLLVVSGRPVAWTNGVHYARFDPAEADRKIAEATEVFKKANVPALWRVTDTSEPADLSTRLEANGWRYHDGLPFLSAPIDAIPALERIPEGLLIERATDTGTQSAWKHAMEHGFGMSRDEADVVFDEADASGFDPEGPWVRFAGLLDGRPVASSGLILWGGLAAVYNVATVPQARRRGIGTAMTKAAIDHACGLGYHVAVLGTSDAGRGIYERMGFRQVEVVREYLWEPETTDPYPEGT